MREIALGEAISGEITDAQSALVYPFMGMVDQIIDVMMTSSDEALDPLLIVLTSKGQEIVRNDDESSENRNSVIRGLRLPESGMYYVVATRYLGRFGLSEGSYTLTVDQATTTQPPLGFFSTPLIFDKLAAGFLDNISNERTYTFRADAGDVISIDMQRLNADESLNPFLALTDNLGNLLITDDDIDARNQDARIDEFVLPRDGYYTVIAARYLSGDTTMSGEYTIALTLVDRGGKSGDYPIDAQIDPQNSRTVRGDNRFFTTFVAGDVIVDGGDESRLQTLLTVELPPDLEPDTIASVELRLPPCDRLGGGFNELGDLTIYQDPFGVLDANRNVVRPTVGARVLDTISACESIDITEVTVEALENRRSRLQFRLTFRSAENNNEADQIRFIDPRVLIYLQP
jgi:hypothetical protein